MGTPVDDPASTGTRPAGGLRRGSIGVAGMVFMVVAATAPLTAMASNLSLSLGFGAGAGTLGWIVLIGLLLVVFTSGYVALARTVVSAGAYHAYISTASARPPVAPPRSSPVSPTTSPARG